MTHSEQSSYEDGDYSETVKKLLTESKFTLILTEHATIRLEQRQIPENDVRENITNPKKLVFAKKRKKAREHEESYQCYFKQSKNLTQVYGLAFNFNENSIYLVTAFKGRPKLQKMVKYGKN